MKGRFITEKIIAEFKEHLVLGERSKITVEKYIRDVKAFSVYSKQQATIADLTETISSADTKGANIRQKTDGTAHSIGTANKPVATSQPAPEKDWDKILAPVGVGTAVKHKTFGEGAVVWMDKAKKYIRVKFAAGEKQFIFPDAFVGGFLSVK